MERIENLSATIRELCGIVDRLERDFSDEKRHFTIDGHLLGSIGEVYAAERYGIELFISSEAVHDGKAPDGRLVQIKATQGERIAVSSEPKYLIVLYVSKTGEFEEIYNGPGGPVWNQFKDKKLPKNGQYQISVSRLSRLDAEVRDEDRIPRVY